ncbi:lactate racemase domain-containing protein [Paenibacillus hamazuiensis]|uniref:lactate racemase domain-containing protein n=1 Tax=Paenibacillus hamazuiensis TaxID=2936508 RepID=UPI00200E0A22|nr:lactate racemase domain-containing protein [Paenibacillus hamazuiensis]
MQSLDLKKFPEIPLPKFLKVEQYFQGDKVEDLPKEIRAKMEPHSTDLTGKRIAVGVGSRGIANLAQITKSVVDNLKAAGAEPFIIPAMGSHGGATADGQAELLAAFGVTEAAMGCPIDASMEVESIGVLEEGLPVYVAKSALQADGITFIARVKPHTCFRGPIESGLCKMLAIGFGKQVGAASLHNRGFGRFAELIPKAAQMILAKTNVLFGVALIENAYEETSVVEVVPKEDIMGLEREKQLLELAKARMGRILLPSFDVLVIGEIGKNISGDGQDPNVTGLFFTPYASGGPTFKKCAILDVTEQSHGNANGVGMADVTTRKLFDKIDFISMYTNAFTSTEVQAVKVPMVASTPEDALRMAVKMCNGVRPFGHKIVWIQNTLELRRIVISEPLLSEAESHPQISLVSEPKELVFSQGEPQLHLL